MAQVDSKSLIVHLIDPLSEAPTGLTSCCTELPEPNRLVLRYRPSETRVGDLLGQLQARGCTIADLTTEQTDLEDIFLQLTRAPAEDASAEESRGRDT